MLQSIAHATVKVIKYFKTNLVLGKQQKKTITKEKRKGIYLNELYISYFNGSFVKRNKMVYKVEWKCDLN